MSDEMREEYESIGHQGNEPDLKALNVVLEDLARKAEEVHARQDAARDVLLCQWEGQSADGRKHAEEMEEAPRPFEGAADSRVRLADGVVVEKLAVLVEAALRLHSGVGGVESGDLGLAGKMSTLLAWLRDNAMAVELRRELTLAAGWYLGDDPGVAVMGVFWQKSTGVEQRVLELGAVAQALAAGQRDGPAALERAMVALTREEHAGVAVDLLAGLLPGVNRKELRAAARALRTDGRAEVRVPFVRESRPKVVAYRWCRDVFWAPEVSDLERAPVVFVRDWLSKQELRERVLTDEWDEGWVEAAEKQEGKSAVAAVWSDGRMLDGVSDPERKGMVEVWWAYARASAESGACGIEVTVFCPGVVDEWAWHGPLDFAHGRLPFVVMPREWLSRNLNDSRGWPELVGTHQTEVKVQRDTRSDHAQLSTMPPLKVRMSRMGVQFALAPMAQLPVTRMDDMEFMSMPQYPAMSVEVEKATRAEVSEMAGRRTADDPGRALRMEQHEVQQWLAFVNEVWRMVLQLCQQFLDPVEIARVVGGESMVQKVSREDIRGMFDLRVQFDARTLDLDFLKMMLDFTKEMVGLDQDGVIDRAGLVRWGFQALNPQLAEAVVRDVGSVTQREVEEEQSNVLKMSAGIEPPMVEKGQNHGLRAQVLQQTIGQSPKLQQQLQGDQLFQKLVQARMKHLQGMVQQRQNAQIGRVMSRPVMGGGR